MKPCGLFEHPVRTESVCVTIQLMHCQRRQSAAGYTCECN